MTAGRKAVKRKADSDGVDTDANTVKQDIQHALTCQICHNDIVDPRRCSECYTIIGCATCSKQWIGKHKTCTVCKAKISSDELIAQTIHQLTQSIIPQRTVIAYRESAHHNDIVMYLKPTDKITAVIDDFKQKYMKHSNATIVRHMQMGLVQDRLHTDMIGYIRDYESTAVTLHQAGLLKFNGSTKPWYHTWNVLFMCILTVLNDIKQCIVAQSIYHYQRRLLLSINIL